LLKSGKGSRPRKCKVCGEKFRPVYTSVQAVCGAYSCALTHGITLQRKARTNDLRSFRANDRSTWVKKAQKEFNKWVRNRDSECVSCETSNPGNQFHAGHYRSTAAAPELRFHPDNCHRQCAQCNTMKSGNIGPYRIALIAKIGQERVDWLEGPHEPAKYTIDDLKAIHAKYKQLNKEASQ